MEHGAVGKKCSDGLGPLMKEVSNGVKWMYVQAQGGSAPGHGWGGQDVLASPYPRRVRPFQHNKWPLLDVRWGCLGWRMHIRHYLSKVLSSP